MKKSTKIIFSVLGVILTIVLICYAALWFFFAGSYTRRSISIYEKLCAEDELLPELDELGNYSDVKFRHFHQNYYIFCCDSYTLKVIYDGETYETQKKQLDLNFMFQDEPIDNLDEQDIEPSFSYDGYDFRFLSDDYLAFEFPKKMYLIGTNDDENTIAYIYFDDHDLDSLTTVEFFMEEYINFK